MSDKKDYITRSSVEQLKNLPGVHEEIIQLDHTPKKADLIKIVYNLYKIYADEINDPRGLTVEMFMNAYHEYLKQKQNQNKQDEEEVEYAELPELSEVVDVQRSSDIAKKDTNTLFDKLEDLLSQLIKYLRATVKEEAEDEEEDDDKPDTTNNQTTQPSVIENNQEPEQTNNEQTNNEQTRTIQTENGVIKLNGPIINNDQNEYYEYEYVEEEEDDNEYD